MEDNWFDTADSLKNTDDATFEKMKIPLKLVQMMRLKFNNQENKSQKQEEKKVEIENETEKTKQVEKKIEEKSENTMINEEQLMMFLLEELKKATQTTENYRLTLSLMKTITKNIIADPMNPNLRKIKLTNKKFLENISPFPPALDILKKARYCIKFII